jgi:EmrB/QacA subfamily drug resistance transporter
MDLETEGSTVAVLATTSFLSTGRGKLTLALLTAIGFLDFADASIVNIALPDIRNSLHLSVSNLQWVPSGYLLTYGGLMLLGGRMADLLGRRRVLVAGTMLFAISSMTGGFADSAASLVGSRIAQGFGAALMMPAALSLLTTLFSSGTDRAKAVGAWAGMGAVASAAGVFLGGVLTDGPGWRWVLFVNPPVAALLLLGVFALLPGESSSSTSWKDFDVLGSIFVTSGMLLLVFVLVKAPDQGWGSFHTLGELTGATALLAAFVVTEFLVQTPLIPLRFLRTPGLAAADVTFLFAVAGFGAMFYFLTLYMQTILGLSPLQAGAAYLPATLVGGLSAVVATRLITRVGTRPVLITGLLLTAAGLFDLSRIPVAGSYVHDVLPGLLIVGIGIVGAFAAVTTAGNAGVPADKAGLAAALLNAAEQLGGALGLAVLTAVATGHSNHLLGRHDPPIVAATAGFQRALFVGGIFVLVAAVVGCLTRSTRGEPVSEPTFEPVVEPGMVAPAFCADTVLVRGQ